MVWFQQQVLVLFSRSAKELQTAAIPKLSSRRLAAGLEPTVYHHFRALQCSLHWNTGDEKNRNPASVFFSAQLTTLKTQQRTECLPSEQTDRDDWTFSRPVINKLRLILSLVSPLQHLTHFLLWYLTPCIWPCSISAARTRETPLVGPNHDFFTVSHIWWISCFELSPLLWPCDFC